MIAFTVLSLAAFTYLPRLQLSRTAWLVDGAAALALVVAPKPSPTPFAHGAARHVDVVLARNGPSATIEVCDDGGNSGDPAPWLKNALRLMRARADTIGADLSLGPGPRGRGTRVALTFSTTPTEGNAEP